MTQKAMFRGGPFDGRTYPAEIVPWPAFVPRDPPHGGPMKTLTREEVYAQPHYEIVSMSSTHKGYAWVDVA